jgi:glycerophosphoryl diester phosphodiesterase
MWYNNPNAPTYDLKEIATYAHGVGPNYQWLFFYENETFNLNLPSKFIEEAHSLDLAVHPYTL